MNPISQLFIVELSSRRIVHFNVTTHPTDAWVAQQLWEATPFGQNPRFLIRDRDRKYGDAFTRLAKGSPIELLKTPYQDLRAVIEQIENDTIKNSAGALFGL